MSEVRPMSDGQAVDRIAKRFKALLKVPECSALHDDLPSTFRSLAACLPEAVAFDVLCLILQERDRVRILRKTLSGNIHILEKTEADIPVQVEWKIMGPVVINSDDSTAWFSLEEFLEAGDLKSCVIVPLTAPHENIGSMILGSLGVGEYH